MYYPSGHLSTEPLYENLGPHISKLTLGIPINDGIITMRETRLVTFWGIHLGLLGQTKQFVDGYQTGHVENAIWENSGKMESVKNLKSCIQVYIQQLIQLMF